MRKLIWTCLIILLAVGTLIAGGSQEAGSEGSGGPEKVEISFGWWGAEARHAYTQELAGKFAEMNPGVSFTFQPNSWGGYWEKITTQAAAGSLPTVMQFYYTYIPAYAENGMFLDLTPYVEDGTLDVSTMDENLLATGYYEDQLVTIPLSMSARTMIYSPEALKEAGMDMPGNDWTWDEFMEMCKTYKERTGNYAVDGYSNGYYMLLLMLAQQGYNLYDPSGKKLGFDDEKPLMMYFNFWDEMVKSGCVYTPDVNVSQAQLPSEQSLIAQEKAAFMYNANTFPSWAQNERLKLAPVPYLVPGEDKMWTVPGLSFSISSAVDEATAGKAVEFLSWWLNSEEVAMVQGTDRGFPASTEYQGYLTSGEMDPIQQGTFDYFAYLRDHSGPMPPLAPKGNFEVTDLLVEKHEEMASGMKTPAQAAKEFLTEANEILERANR